MTQGAAWMMLLWWIGLAGACLFCVVRAIVDLRARKYVWGALGLVSAALFLLTPIQTTAVKIDMPEAH